MKTLVVLSGKCTRIELSHRTKTLRRNCHETNQKATAKKTLSIVAIIAFAFLTLANFASAQDSQDNKFHNKFRVSSTTFKNNSILPISAIHNITLPDGTNGCSIDGSPGADESPELSWKGVPRGTASFVVITFDTLGFTHWGMYNIPPTITELPENAGVAGSAYGQQVVNTYGDISYGGPCPPANFPPNVHPYVFTVYALDQELEVLSLTNFPARADTLYNGLVEAGEHGQILASASITGLYSTTPKQPAAR
jgi:Raf kinase inhibitor-like YbhB/YbcL family protein